MYRYFALIAEERGAQRMPLVRSIVQRIRSANTNWKITCKLDDLIVFHTGERAGRWQSYDLDSEGVILGKLFRRLADGESNAENLVLSEADANGIRRSRGRDLVERYWGRYVAFLRGAQGRNIVIRDPMGGLPCYTAHADGIRFFFSHMEDYLEFVPTHLSIDWRHIGACLLSDRLVSNRTGFTEVTQVRAGERFEVGTLNGSTTFYWHPVEICQSAPIEDPKHATTALREAIHDSVQAWGSCYASILHGLSGGLDSSVVLSCLADASAQHRARVVCLNLRTATPEGDERVFARQAATRAGCALVETIARPLLSDPTRMFNVAGFASPTLTTFVSENDDFQARVVEEYGCEAVFSGQGGDHLFQQHVSNLIAAEFISRKGLRPRVLALALRTARTTRKSVWSVLRSAIRHGLFGDGFDPYPETETPAFLRRSCSAFDRADIVHPWVQDGACLPGAKHEQVFAVVDCQLLTAMSCRYADIVHPLISQPIIECALRIPSYVLSDGGRDRAIVRTAFADSVPAEIISRTTKGGATGFYHNAVHDGAKTIRELLLDGILVREGLLDRKILEEELSERQLIKGSQSIFTLLSLIRTEAWLGEATRVGRRAAA